MKSWGLSFITEENFKKHVAATIEKYGEKLESFDIKRFNKNIVDPIKLICNYSEPPLFKDEIRVT